jgi:hypothetical protein
MFNSNAQDNTDQQDYLADLAQNEKINSWQYNFYKSILDKGDVSSDLFNTLIEDYSIIKALGIDTSEEWYLWQYIDTYAEDLLFNCYKDRFKKDFAHSLSDSELQSLKEYIFKRREDKKERISFLRSPQHVCNAIHEWIDANLEDIKDYVESSLSKSSYPTMGEWMPTRPSYDVNKWIQTLSQAYKAAATLNIDKDAAIRRAVKDWDDSEVESFKRWVKYYEGGEHKKWNVKAMNNHNTFVKEADLDFEIPDFKTEQEIMGNFERWRKALLGRINTALKTPLEHLRGLINKNEYNLIKNKLVEVLSIIYQLEPPTDHRDAKAKMTHIQDCLIRFSCILHTNKCRKEAQIVDQITKEAFEDGILSKFGASNITEILNDLERIEEELKSRRLIRLLSSVDLELARLGMASYFPELGDAISKLFDSFGYSSNKVSEVVSRLRGGEKRKVQEQSKPVKIVEETA